MIAGVLWTWKACDDDGDVIDDAGDGDVGFV